MLAVAAKALSMFVSIPEAVLSQALCKVEITHGRIDESKHAGPVQLHKAFEVLDLKRRVIHAHRDEPGCRRRFHDSNRRVFCHKS